MSKRVLIREVLHIVPTGLREANTFISKLHRHHKPVAGMKFAIAVADEGGQIRGVAIVGRPVARMSNDGFTLEVNRCCTDGTRNACSILYAAAWRAARAMGYKRLITHTLPHEGGTSLRATGFTLIGEAGGGSWSRPSRQREDKAPLGVKLRWEMNLLI